MAYVDYSGWTTAGRLAGARFLAAGLAVGAVSVVLTVSVSAWTGTVLARVALGAAALRAGAAFLAAGAFLAGALAAGALAGGALSDGALAAGALPLIF